MIERKRTTERREDAMRRQKNHIGIMKGNLFVRIFIFNKVVFYLKKKPVSQVQSQNFRTKAVLIITWAIHQLGWGGVQGQVKGSI